eukprot:349137_1
MEKHTHQFAPDNVSEFKEVFDKYNTDENVRLYNKQMLKAIQTLGVDIKITDMENILKEVDNNVTNIDFNAFLSALWLIQSTGDASGFTKFIIQPKLIPITVNYNYNNSEHINQHNYAEASAFAKILNHYLKNDLKLKYLLPINPNHLDLMKKISDGIIVARFLNMSDWRIINYDQNGNLNRNQMIQNQNINIFTAKSMGIKIYSTSAEDLVDAEKNVIMALGFLSQIITTKLVNCISIRSFPHYFNELIEEGHIFEDGEDIHDLFALWPQEMLYRWVNYHLKTRACSIMVRNFNKDLKDGKVYMELLKSLIDNQKQFNIDIAVLDSADTSFERITQTLNIADCIGINTFLTTNEVKNAHVYAYEKLNVAFMAELFHWNMKHKLQKDELLIYGYCRSCNVIVADIINLIIELNAKVLNKYFKQALDEYNHTLRVEMFLIKWINSLGINDVYIFHLFHDCSDGLVLLKIIDKISPGRVRWKKVEKKPRNKFRKLSNTNYAVVLVKQLNISTGNMGGCDIVDKNKKIVVGFVWQLMRWYLFRQCMVLTERDVSEKDVLQFCNESIINCKLEIKPQIDSFTDEIMASGMFFICLIASMNANVINWDFVIKPSNIHNDNHRMLNAKYIICVTRKIGVNNVFLMAEDIVDVNSKMCMTFCAAVMAQNDKIKNYKVE